VTFFGVFKIEHLETQSPGQIGRLPDDFGALGRRLGLDTDGCRILLFAARHDLQRAIWQRPLQHLRLLPWLTEPRFKFIRFRKDDGHRLRMDRASVFGSVVRKANRSVSISPSLSLRTDFHCGTQIPAKKASGNWRIASLVVVML
jgi:hypothetical protein